MSDPTTFVKLRELADMEGRRVMYQIGSEIGHPCYGDGPRTLTEWTCPACKETIRRSEDGTAFRPCKCLTKVYNDARWSFTQAHRPAVLAAEKQRSGITPLYMTASFASFIPRPGTEEALRVCQEYAGGFDPDDPRGLILFGHPGTGKTHLAAAVIHRIMDDMDVAPVFVEAVQLLHEIRQRREGGDDPVERCSAATLLVLDDLGNHQVTPFGQDQLYAILAGRYTNRRPTIITTNCDGPKLTEVFGPAFRSRLYEMCKAVPVAASDYRAEKAKED